MIDKRFKDEAIRIRKEYLVCMQKILEKEEKINVEKNNIEKLINEMTELCNMKDMNNSALNDKLLDIEEKIKKIQEEFIPINNVIEELKKQAKFLYSNIKVKSPELSDQDIMNIINSHISKL